MKPLVSSGQFNIDIFLWMLFLSFISVALTLYTIFAAFTETLSIFLFREKQNL